MNLYARMKKKDENSKRWKFDKIKTELDPHVNLLCLYIQQNSFFIYILFIHINEKQDLSMRIK